MGRGYQSQLEHGRRDRNACTDEDKEKARKIGILYYKKHKEKILERKRKISKIAKEYNKNKQKENKICH